MRERGVPARVLGVEAGAAKSLSITRYACSDVLPAACVSRGSGAAYPRMPWLGDKQVQHVDVGEGFPPSPLSLTGAGQPSVTFSMSADAPRVANSASM